MSNVPPPLPPDIAEMLALEDELDDVSPDLAKSIWAGVEDQITTVPGGGGGGDPSPAPAPAPAPSPSPSAGTGIGRVVSAALTSAVVAGVVGFAIGRASAPQTVVTNEAPRPIASAPASVIAPVASVAASTVPTASSAPPAVASAPPAVHPTAPASDFSAERSLLERARNALARSDGRAAMDAIDEHQRRFPSGSLAEEREALAVRALLATGKRADAERRAASFRQRYPKSLFAAMLEADLDAGR